MIEIKCTEEQKEILTNSWKTDNDAICDALTPDDCRKANGCNECAEKNIKWVIINNPEEIETHAAMKPKNIHQHVDHKSGECPICGTRLAHFGDMNYCHKCGNKLDWEDAEDAQ